MKSIIPKLIVSFLLTAGVPSWAASITQKQEIGPHGGQIAEDANHRFEVKLDPEKGTVNVYTLRSSRKLSPSMSIILYRDVSTGRTIELQAVDPKQALPHYQGQLSPAQDSYVGFAIRIG